MERNEGMSCEEEDGGESMSENRDRKGVVKR